MPKKRQANIPTEKEIRESTHEFGGGHLAELPKPHFRRYGKHRKELRPVRVGVHKYLGLGQHYYVSLSEADNPIWDAKEKGWRLCWDDSGGKGELLHNRFGSLTSATLWVRTQAKKRFPASRYKLSADVSYTNLEESEEQTWFGHFKEGD